MKTTLTLFSLLAFSASVSANPVRCEQGELERGIEVVYAEPGQPLPCEVIYDKSAEGSMESLWRADHEAGFCEARAQSLISKLESLGWICAVRDEQAP